MPEIKLNLKPNLLRLFRYLSAIILNYLNEFRKKSNIIDVFKQVRSEPEKVRTLQSEITENKKSTLRYGSNMSYINQLS
ncbi:hypothetical protein OTSUT76_1030 [Orientia tsutsugamushi str. UT76]|uniref:ATP-binding protein n=1 Tax=Orientia tsutsugamushi TaxID=784 RepID=A0A2U3R9Z6_ORITS|nr:hypothetical protein OTSUT76_1030 [Orientia tsutsugamushi str. UT76]SPR10074.1 ATP-binding protein [Orientia tsutsugamushi]